MYALMAASISRQTMLRFDLEDSARRRTAGALCHRVRCGKLFLISIVFFPQVGFLVKASWRGCVHADGYFDRFFSGFYYTNYRMNYPTRDRTVPCSMASVPIERRGGAGGAARFVSHGS